ncbi:hypothetical protein [Microbulbifer sp. VAAF005]|uniref:hypothetical protein n=1 Tax=Microbulbifer sp. VAAF005 TaxID=3034230 RepID=UPI0024AE8242|nr:hypothetical protein [Microbulbifer sp. VAAF005]WHI46776.1 hypothetical protein P0078_24280 [Microbulbifer sp. VAAF005]
MSFEEFKKWARVDRLDGCQQTAQLKISFEVTQKANTSNPNCRGFWEAHENYIFQEGTTKTPFITRGPHSEIDLIKNF